MGVIAALTADFALLVVSLVAAFMVAAFDRGELTRSGGFGLRTAATTASDEAWNAGHAAARPALHRLAVIAAACALPPLVLAQALAGRFPLGSETIALLVVVAAYAYVGHLIADAVRVADAAARAVPAPGPAASWPDATEVAPVENAV